MAARTVSKNQRWNVPPVFRLCCPNAGRPRSRNGATVLYVAAVRILTALMSGTNNTLCPDADSTPWLGSVRSSKDYPANDPCYLARTLRLTTEIWNDCWRYQAIALIDPKSGASGHQWVKWRFIATIHPPKRICSSHVQFALLAILTVSSTSFFN